MAVMRRSYGWGVVTALWLGVVVLGLAQLELYEASPGRVEPAPYDWPPNAAVERDPKRPTLLLFLHPRCPCARLTLRELDGLLRSDRGAARVLVLFLAPDDTDPDWERTAHWDTAAVLPGVQVHRDVGGRQAALFGAHTSGQALVYTAEGRLAFQGGITAARGHSSGPNPGRDAVRALLRGEPPAVAHAPVFGCPLDDPREGQES